MGAIAASIIVGAVMAAQAAVGPESRLTGAGEPARLIQAAQVERRYRLDMAAQPLASALRVLHERTGLQFIFATQTVASLTAPALRGEYTAREALAKVLEGSGVGHRFTGEGTAALRVAQEGGTTQLEGIVVTGEKIDRDYVDAFTSIGVATEADIENYNLDDLYDTFNQMANVRANSSNRGNSAFQIRGVNADGVTQPANSAPLVSVIIDGATQNVEGLKRGARGTWDIKQVEVLRGPQSTLYGRTALAGAVVVETNDPTYTPEMEAKGVIGDQERRDGAFMVSGPIIDNQVAFRLAGEWRDQEKDITFEDPANEELGEDKYRNLRGKLLIEPKDVAGLSALLTFSHTFDSPAANAVTGPDFFARRFDGSASTTEFREVTNNNYVANVAYGITDGYKIRSISSYIDTDLDLSSAPSSTVFFRDDLRDGEDITQDLRLEIDDKARGLSGVIGLFYGNFSNDIDTDIRYDASFFGGPAGFIVPVQVGTITTETDTKAIYADLRYKLFDKVSLIGGARYQQDTVHNTSDVTGFPPFVPDVVYDSEAEFNVFLPKFGLAYDIDDTQTVALTATRGYRQGFSELIIGTDVVNEVDPEFVWTYELAYRKTTADKRLTFGVNLFYNEYTDQQITVNSTAFPGFQNTTNAGNSTSYGAEVEARYDFGNGLTMFGAVGLLKTEFEELEDRTCVGGSCEGNEFPEAPNLTFAFGGTYKHSSGFFVSASANYTGDYYSAGDINNLATFEIENRFLVNAKAGYQYENWTISAFADNLFDEEYLTGISTTSDEAYIGDGRTVGVELRAKF